MKKLLLLLLFLVQNTLTAQDLSEANMLKLKNGIETGNYSVLDNFMSRENLGTYIPLRNGNAVIKTYYEFKIDNILRKDTIPFTFKNANQTIIYTNEYGFLFVEDSKALWDLEEIKNLPNAVCCGFYDMMKKAFKAKNPEQIIELYNEYNIDLYESQSKDYMYAFILNLGNLLYAKGIDYNPDYKDSLEAFKYTFVKLYPTKKQQTTVLLNLLLYRIVTINGSNIETPYNRSNPLKKCKN